MALNRRNVLLGLGTIVTGVGAAIGTGAFTTVTAERTVDVSVTGDSDAFLAFQVDGTVTIDGSDVDAGDPGYANIPTDGALEILLDGSGEGNVSSASGLNVDAVTTISPLFSVTNNGTEDVGFYVDADEDDNNISINSGTIENTVGSSGTIDFTFRDLDGDTSIVSEGNAVEITSGSSARVEIEIDTTGIDSAGSDINDDLLSELQVVADTNAL
ncbi:hypothetical protein [Halobellus salinisoli]|uniref:hypothetical protein n=1 Tax=Halobellus salinisoli TaxID=3108500 RepID=UPI00300984CB